MFRIDHGYHRNYPFASPLTPGLRTFLIDHRLPGRGIAKGDSSLSDGEPRQPDSAKGIFGRRV